MCINGSDRILNMIRRLRYYISLLLRMPLAMDRFAIRYLGLVVYHPAELRQLDNGPAQSLKEAVELLATHDLYAHHLLHVCVTEVVISSHGGWIETCGPVLILPGKALKLGPPRLAAVLARKVMIKRLVRSGLPLRFSVFAKLMRLAYAREIRLLHVLKAPDRIIDQVETWKAELAR